MDTKNRDLLAERREPAIWFRAVEKAHSKSRKGGLPSLPEGVDWPVHPDTRRPLHFLAQVDLAALPDTPLPGCPFGAALPRRGMLFFFSFAESLDDDLGAADVRGIPKHTRVIHASTAGTDRAAPANLSTIFLNPGTMGDGAREESLIPIQHLRGYAIDTFWAPQYFGADGKVIHSFQRNAEFDAKFQSIVDATGEAAAVFASHEAVPNPAPSYYTVIGDRDPVHRMSWLQMFGAESLWEVASERPIRDRSKVLLLEFPLDAYDLGSLQFWIKSSDLKARRFDRVIGVPCDS